MNTNLTPVIFDHCDLYKSEFSELMLITPILKQVITIPLIQKTNPKDLFQKK
jgi:hypothetical protein